MPLMYSTLTRCLFRQVGWLRLAFLAGVLLGTAQTASAQQTNADCLALSSFSYPQTTINSVNFNIGGPYVAGDTWHLAFSNLPPWCEVNATIKADTDSS